jgi:hypothetical protein
MTSLRSSEGAVDEYLLEYYGYLLEYYGSIRSEIYLIG